MVPANQKDAVKKLGNYLDSSFNVKIWCLMHLCFLKT